MIITGGFYTSELVTRYNMMGHVKDLPNLITPRYGHGCAGFKNKNNKLVDNLSFYYLSCNLSRSFDIVFNEHIFSRSWLWQEVKKKILT